LILLATEYQIGFGEDVFMIGMFANRR